jgi:anti-sigma regulatory factor (Ser/Thr protein kinase)
MKPAAPETNSTETEIARIAILPEKAVIGALADMVADIAEAYGIDRKESGNLDRVLIDIIDNIVESGFEGDRGKPVDVIVSKRLHALVVAVEDKGLPFDYEKLERGEEKRFSAYLSRHYADEVHFTTLGTGGNRTEIVKNLPATDIRTVMDISEHIEHSQAAEAPPDEEIKVGMLDAGKVHELVRLVYKCYGYTYANEFMYYPEQIEARLSSGVMLSGAAYNSRQEIIGHVGFIFSSPGARVAESGEAVVDPRYRGRGIFQKIKNYLVDQVAHMNVAGIYGEAVTVHPYSQKGSIELGGRETGFLLGYSPGSVSFHNISEAERPRRQSVAMMFTPVKGSAREKVYVPGVYKDVIAGIYGRIGFDRELTAEDEGTGFKGRQKGRTNVSVRHDHNQALIKIEKVGRMTVKEIGFQLKHLAHERFDCIYIDIPLRQKGAGYVGSAVRNLGFFFGCIIPEYGDGDVLRLQYLNNVDISKDDIKTASEFGQNLLDAILADMAEVAK